MHLKNNDDTKKYVIAFSQALGIKQFALTEHSDNADEISDPPILITLPIDSEKGIAMIVDHSVLLHQYLFGSTEINDYLLFLLLLTESMLLSYQESNSAKELNLDSLKKINITENLMTSTAPTVGSDFSLSLLARIKNNKLENASEVATSQAEKVLRLTGISLLSLLNLGKMPPRQKGLFVGANTNEALVDIIVNDVRSMKDKVLDSWDVDKHNRWLCDQVEQAIIRIYSHALQSELVALKQEMAKFNDMDKRAYMETIKSRPEGNLIFRARQTAERIMLEVDQSQSSDQTHEKALAS